MGVQGWVCGAGCAGWGVQGWVCRAGCAGWGVQGWVCGAGRAEWGVQGGCARPGVRGCVCRMGCAGLGVQGRVCRMGCVGPAACRDAPASAPPQTPAQGAQLRLHFTPGTTKSPGQSWSSERSRGGWAATVPSVPPGSSTICTSPWSLQTPGAVRGRACGQNFEGGVFPARRSARTDTFAQPAPVSAQLANSGTFAKLPRGGAAAEERTAPSRPERGKSSAPGPPPRRAGRTRAARRPGPAAHRGRPPSQRRAARGARLGRLRLRCLGKEVDFSET